MVQLIVCLCVWGASACVDVRWLCGTSRLGGLFFGLVSFWDQSIMLSHVEILESMEQQQQQQPIEPSALAAWLIPHTAQMTVAAFPKIV